jgi:DNA repair protein RecO (recombination protein O)
MMMSETLVHHLYILHSRKYRETSVLCDIFSMEEGRYSLVFRGARSHKSRHLGLLQPFSPILVSVYGEGELRTGGSVDVEGRSRRLAGENLLIGMYVNELLYRVLGSFDKMPGLFSRYENLLTELEHEDFQTVQLRKFELSLLAILGYGITFDMDTSTGEVVKADGIYQFVVEQGFSSVPEGLSSEHTFIGQQLLEIARGEYTNAGEIILKQVVRKSLQPLLGARPLKSRSLFVGRGR